MTIREFISRWIASKMPLRKSPAVQEIERLRQLPGNCPEANALLDQALAVQKAEELKAGTATRTR